MEENDQQNQFQNTAIYNGITPNSEKCIYADIGETRFLVTDRHLLSFSKKNTIFSAKPNGILPCDEPDNGVEIHSLASKLSSNKTYSIG